VVGYVGRLAAEKNLDFLLGALAAALEHCPNGQVLIVGDGPVREQLQTLAVELGIADRVRFTGALAGQELADAYRSLDVFAFSSHSETQGMVLAEAMAAGVPVVALDAAGAREIVRDGVNGRLVASPDRNEFAASVAALFNAPPRSESVWPRRRGRRPRTTPWRPARTGCSMFIGKLSNCVLMTIRGCWP
jgi:1,2-diacylglycerol 3-alpha-glucosyltransferase